MQAWAVWDSLTFILNGLVFVLMGLQLPHVLEAIRDQSLRTLILYGAVFSAFLIVLRLIWVYPGAYVSYLIRRRLLHQTGKTPTVRQTFVVGWTGMRGVISLAAAIAVPQVLANGEPFSQRNTIIFLTFSVILVTLVLQGLTLPPLIRAMGLAGVAMPLQEEREARTAILEAAMAHLEEMKSEGSSVDDDVYVDLRRHYQHRLETLGQEGEASSEVTTVPLHRTFADVTRELLRAERQAAVRLRNQRRIGDELLRELEHELDLGELKLGKGGGGGFIS